MVFKFLKCKKILNLEFNILPNLPIKYEGKGTSFVVQWLRLCSPNTGGPASIPGQGTRSRMPQLRAHMPQATKRS